MGAKAKKKKLEWIEIQEPTDETGYRSGRPYRLYRDGQLVRIVPGAERTQSVVTLNVGDLRKALKVFDDLPEKQEGFLA